MSRFFAVPSLITVSALVTITACSPSGAGKSADTGAAVAATDTSAPAAVPAVAPPAVAPAAVSTDSAKAAIVPININTATDEEILRIPGVGPRMLREFKEYRPYTSIEQFRREIGKYVDKDQVATWEKYIVIK
jgi:DNA uptake protein ComE-like DNA-binding protein